MEHRKFGKLVDQLKEPTAAQAEEVVAALQRRGDGDAVRQIIEQRVSEARKCPRRGAAHIRRYGMEHGLQRYRCVGCGRTFNALTGTPLARLRSTRSLALGMISPFLDANVLYPTTLRSVLLELGRSKVFRILWSEHEHQEWMRALQREHPRIQASRITRMRELMEAYVENATVSGYESLIDGLTLPDPNDRMCSPSPFMAKRRLLSRRTNAIFLPTRYRLTSSPPSRPTGSFYACSRPRPTSCWRRWRPTGQTCAILPCRASNISRCLSAPALSKARRRSGFFMLIFLSRAICN